MNVEIHEHEGVDIRTGERVVVGDRYGPQYRVYVDGIGVGYIGSKPGSKLLLTENRFAPSELKHIGEKVSELLGSAVGEVKQPPKVDPELLRSKDDGIEADDFD